MTTDQLYMHRALQIAQWGKGKTAPNPMVGCVIVAQDRIIAEGWHTEYGQPHAEVNAVARVGKDDIALLPESTFYVTLEPCNHTGKTPPCTDLLLAVRPKRVVICNTDPNPLVAGKGIKRLQEAGITIQTGVLAEAGKELNKRFFTYHLAQRPYIILKWAMTADNFIAREDFTSKWISNPLARQIAHQWRTEEQAILVGTRTALHDNPQLTSRDYAGKNPTRVLAGKAGKIPATHHIFDTQAETIALEGSPQEIVQNLYEKKIISVLIEGGKYVLESFLEAELFDELRVIQNPEMYFQTGISAPKIRGSWVSEKKIQENSIFFYRNSKSIIWQIPV